MTDSAVKSVFENIGQLKAFCQNASSFRINMYTIIEKYHLHRNDEKLDVAGGER